MFLGFKMPKEVVNAIRGKQVLDDPDFVKEVKH